jgi:hypothetical protein
VNLMRQLRTPIVALLLAIGVTALSACAGGPTTSSPIVRSRIERSIERSYSYRYVALSRLLGRRDVSVKSMGARAVCDKGGVTKPDVGPGGDWNCWLAYTDPNVPNSDNFTKVEMNVHANDCYTAGGQQKLVGPLYMVDAHGNQVINPAFEFDGCFDPDSSARPNGTMILIKEPPLPGAPPKSELSMTTGLLKADSKGRVPIELSCGKGPCTGTTEMTLQNTKLGTIRYDIPADGTKTYYLNLSASQIRDGGVLTPKTHEITPKYPPPGQS